MSFHPPLRPDTGSKQTGPKPWYEEYLEGKVDSEDLDYLSHKMQNFHHF